MSPDGDGAPSVVVELQCNLDDMTGEELGYTMDLLLEAGALDVWFTPIQMKKNRPAVMLSLLARAGDAERLRLALLEHTTTLGVRWRELERQVAQRETMTVETPWGQVRCKLKRLQGRAVGVKPEFDDCAQLARQHRIPLRLVSEAARSACAAHLSATTPADHDIHEEKQAP